MLDSDNDDEEQAQMSMAVPKTIHNNLSQD
jgi:hypothetical protein